MSAMLLHLASYAPNARVVTMFLHEKALELPLREITHGQNREPAFVRMNPMGQIPVLEFPDGFCLSENVAICEYLEAQNPDPPLIGADDRERAETRMWARRLDLNICEHLANITRFGLAEDYFRSHILVVPEIIPGLAAMVEDRLRWLDLQMGDGRTFVCGERFTLADILLFCFLDFADTRVKPVEPGLTRVSGWLERVRARPSAVATRPRYPDQAAS